MQVGLIIDQKINLSPYIHNTVHRMPYPSICVQQNQNFIIQKNPRTTKDLTNKVVTSTLDIVYMQEKKKRCRIYHEKDKY